MNLFRRKPLTCFALVLFLAGIGMFTLAGCGSKENEDNNLKELTLYEVAHSIFYAPQYVAIELDYFEEEGLSVNLYNGSGADNVMTAMISGDADIGFMGSEASIYVYAQGAKDYAVNFAQLTQRAGNFLVAREEDADFSWDKIKGTTVLGGRPGGMPEMVFEYILRRNNINPAKDLTIVTNIDFGSTAGAFSGGQGDYTVEFEPFATSLELENEGYVVASLGTDSGYVPYTAYCVKKSMMEDTETLQAFTNAIQKGLDYVNSHSAGEIAAVIAPQFSETDLEAIETIVSRYKEQDTWPETTVFKEESFDLLQDILTEAGELDEKVPYTDLVTTAFSEEAVK